MINSFDEFKEYYLKHGRCINDIQPRKNALNDVQLKTRYKRFQQSEKLRLDRATTALRKAMGKQKGKTFSDVVDVRWEGVRQLVLNRDDYECRLMNIIDYDDYITLKTKGGLYTKTLDIAHVLSRGTYPQLKYEPDNLVALNRYSHSMIDGSRHPVSGEPISHERTLELWVDIMGEDQYNRLVQLLENLNLGNPF